MSSSKSNSEGSTSELEKLSEKLKTAIDENNKLKGTTAGFEALNRHVGELESRCKQLDTELQTSKHSLQTAHVELTTLRKTNTTLAADLDVSKQTLRRARLSERTEESTQISLLESQLKQQQEVVVALRNENAAIKDDMEEVEEKFIAEHETVKRLSLNLEAAAEALQYKALEDSGATMNADMDKLHLRIAELEEQLRSNNDGSAWQRVQAASMTNANLSKQLTELEDTVEQHRRLKKKKDEEWRNRARKYELEISDLERQVRLQQTAIQKANDTADAAKKANVISGIDPTEVDALRASRTAALESMAEAETALKAARGEVAELKSTFSATQETARSDHEKREARITELKAERKRLEDKITSMEQAFLSREQDYEDLQREVAALQEVVLETQRSSLEDQENDRITHKSKPATEDSGSTVAGRGNANTVDICGANIPSQTSVSSSSSHPAHHSESLGGFDSHTETSKRALEYDSLQEECLRLKDESADLRRANTLLNETVASQESVLMDLQAEMDSLERERKTEQRQAALAAEAAAEGAAAVSRAVQLASSGPPSPPPSNYSERMLELQSKLDARDTRIHELDAVVAAHQATLDRLQTHELTISTMRDEKSTLEEAVHSLQSQLESVGLVHSAALARVQDDHAATRTQLRDIEAKSGRLESTLERYRQKEIDQALAESKVACEVTNLAEKCTALETELGAASQTLLQTQTEAARSEQIGADALRTSEARAVELQATVERLSGELAGAQSKLRQMDARLLQIHKERDQFLEERDRLLHESQGHIDIQTAEVEAALLEKQSVQQKLDTVAEELKAAESTKQSMSSSLAELTASVTELEALRQALAEAQSRTDRLSRDVEAEKSRVESLEEEREEKEEEHKKHITLLESQNKELELLLLAAESADGMVDAGVALSPVVKDARRLSNSSPTKSSLGSPRVTALSVPRAAPNPEDSPGNSPESQRRLRRDQLASSQIGTTLAARLAIESGNFSRVTSELKVQSELVEALRLKNADLLYKLQATRGSVLVAVRTRPITSQELVMGGKQSVEVVGEDELLCQDKRSDEWRSFSFDKVWGEHASQADVCADIEPLALSVCDGQNVSIIAYGQTGSGKTYTMNGYGVEYGVSYRILNKIFDTLELRRSNKQWKVRRAAALWRKDKQNTSAPRNDSVDTTTEIGLGTRFEFSVSVSMLEIYNEGIRDLLVSSTGPHAPPTLDARQAPSGEVYVPSLSCVGVSGIDDVFSTFEKGQANRATAVTNLNEHSSRSHSLLIVTVNTAVVDERGNSNDMGPDACVSINAGTTTDNADLTLQRSNETSGKLYLVDLAGSERVAKSGVKGTAMREAQNINRSLSALGDVLEALDSKAKHVPYRNSTLTYLLQNSLGAQSRTLMIVTVCPTDLSQDETLYALSFASRVKNISMGNTTAKSTRSSSAAIRTLQDNLSKAKLEAREANRRRHILEESVLDMKKEKKRSTDKIASALETRTRQLEEAKLAAEAHSANMTRRHDELAEKCAHEREAKQAALNAAGAAEAKLRVAQEKARGAERDRDMIMLTLKDKEKLVDRLERDREHLVISAEVEATSRKRREELASRVALRTSMGQSPPTSMSTSVSAAAVVTTQTPSPSSGMSFPRPTYETSGKSSYVRSKTTPASTPITPSSLSSSPSRTTATTVGHSPVDPITGVPCTVRTSSSKSASSADESSSANGGLIAKVAVGASAGPASRTRQSARLASRRPPDLLSPSQQRSQDATRKHQERMAKNRRAASNKSADYW